MLFQQLGEDFVLALEFLLQSVNFLLQTIRNAGAGLLVFKSGCSVLKKLSLPLVKQRWVDVVLVAQIGNAFAFNQMLPENGDLLALLPSCSAAGIWITKPGESRVKKLVC